MTAKTICSELVFGKSFNDFLFPKLIKYQHFQLHFHEANQIYYE